MNYETTSPDLRYDRETETVRIPPNGTGDVRTAVVLAVAEIEDLDPLDMTPLYHAVSPDLLEQMATADHRVTGDLMFNYYGHRIVVDSDGGVVVRVDQD